MLHSDKDFQALLGSYLPAALGFLNLILLSRILPDDLFGKWVIFISLLGTLDSVRSAPIQSSLVNLSSGASPHLAARYYQAGLYFYVAISFALALLVWFIYLFSPGLAEGNMYFFYMLFPAFIVLSIPGYFGQILFLNERRFMSFMWVRLATSVPFSSFLFFVWFFEEDISLLSHAFLIGHLVGSVLAWLKGAFGRSVGKFYWSSLLEVISVGKYMVLYRGFHVFRKNIDVLLLGWLLGPVAAGIYAIPLKIIEIAELALRGFQSNYYPQLVAAWRLKHLSSYKALYTSNLKKLLSFGLVIGLFISVSAPWLILLFAKTEGNFSTIWLLRLMTVGIPLLGWFQLETSICVAQRTFRSLAMWLAGFSVWHVATSFGIISWTSSSQLLPFGLLSTLMLCSTVLYNVNHRFRLRQ